jgi:hypothetical protein
LEQKGKAAFMLLVGGNNKDSKDHGVGLFGQMAG